MKDPVKYDAEEIQKAMESLDGWTLEGESICRSFEFKDFVEAFAFMARIALLAEKQDHHPELWNVYNRVKLSFNTHDVDGLSYKDFKIAKAINSIL